MQDVISLTRLRAIMAHFSADAQALAQKPRTMHVGPFWVRFESATTLLWQLAHMAHNEGIEDDDALQAECDVYQSLLPHAGLLLTVGPQSHGMQAFFALVAALPKAFSLTCGALVAQASAVTPMGTQVQMVLPISAEMRAGFAHPTAVVHCQLQTHAAPLADALRGALFNDREPS